VISAQETSSRGDAERSIWSGVYSPDQAKKGESVYRAECARCHADTLGGGDSAPSLAGDMFLGAWDGKTLADLFERTRATMPLDSPGRLNARDLAAVLAFMLRVNNLPAGSTDLANETEVLKTIKIQREKP